MAPNQTTEPDLFGAVPFVPTVAAAIPRARSLNKPLSTTEEKTDDAFKTISETADLLDLPQHVLRFWESKFTQIKPLKLRGGRRYYRPQDIDILFTIKHLLYKEGYTIKGARRAITQARKQREPLMVEEKISAKARKKPAPAMHDTPLFASLVPVAEAAPVEAAPVANHLAGKKEELRTIHNELLELRKLISGLPTLPTHA